ncbi:DUF6082 family protein [Streptomyces silvensis]|uniref:DUF6082 family protein n=1 Tax=Streptomyces silvensis TaxID=1765722 RepID=UPI003D66E365
MAGLADDSVRQILFANLIVTWWNSSYVSKDMTGSQLSLLLHTFFSGEVGREYWSMAAQGWRDVAQLSKVKRQQRFVAIVDAGYQAALAANSS